jgi:hypothetical protein
MVKFEPVTPQSTVPLPRSPHAYLPARQVAPEVQAGRETALSMSESWIVNEAVLPVRPTPPCKYEFLITKPEALTVIEAQLTTLLSMTVFATVMVHDPV